MKTKKNDFDNLQKVYAATRLPEQRLTTTREYKHNRAMLEAIKRIGNMPRPISMVSKVPEFNNQAKDR
jgi:hypothetical protein